MQVELMKKKTEYTDKNGEQRTAQNFFIKCGDMLVPIAVRYFEDKETGEDKQYATRKTLLSAFATDLPDKQQSNKNGRKATVTEIDDDVPFN